MGKGTGRGEGKGGGEVGEMVSDGAEWVKSAVMCLCLLAVLGPLFMLYGIYMIGDGAVGVDERARDLDLYNADALAWTTTQRKMFETAFAGAVISDAVVSPVVADTLAAVDMEGSTPERKTVIADIGRNEYDKKEGKAPDHEDVKPLYFTADLTFKAADTSQVTLNVKTTSSFSLAAGVDTKAPASAGAGPHKVRFPSSYSPTDHKCYAQPQSKCPTVPACSTTNTVMSKSDKFVAARDGNGGTELSQGFCKQGSCSGNGSNKCKQCCVKATVTAGKPTYSCMLQSSCQAVGDRCTTCATACTAANGVCQDKTTGGGAANKAKCENCKVTRVLKSASLLVKSDGEGMAKQGKWAGPGFRPMAGLGSSLGSLVSAACGTTCKDTDIFKWEPTLSDTGDVVVAVTVRSEDDPYVKAYALTNGSLDFGMSAGDKIKLGTVFLVLGLTFCCITYGSCYCLCQTFGKNKGDGGNKSQVAPQQMSSTGNMQQQQQPQMVQQQPQMMMQPGMQPQMMQQPMMQQQGMMQQQPMLMQQQQPMMMQQQQPMMMQQQQPMMQQQQQQVQYQ